MLYEEMPPGDKDQILYIKDSQIDKRNELLKRWIRFIKENGYIELCVPSAFMLHDLMKDSAEAADVVFPTEYYTQR